MIENLRVAMNDLIPSSPSPLMPGQEGVTDLRFMASSVGMEVTP